MFSAYPTYNRYRTLKLSNPRITGEDVYALQTALMVLSSTTNPGPVDGILGPQTAAAITAAQRFLGITVDGLCGSQTQASIVRRLADRQRLKNNLPVGLVFGQLHTESGCFLGNYSPARADGTYDAGVAQRNTYYTSPEEGFTVPLSIDALGSRIRTYYNKYAGIPTDRRRWELASGSWNAPAFTNWIARSEGATGVPVSDTLQPGITARAAIEKYMDSTTAYMVL